MALHWCTVQNVASHLVIFHAGVSRPWSLRVRILSLPIRTYSLQPTGNLHHWNSRRNALPHHHHSTKFLPAWSVSYHIFAIIASSANSGTTPPALPPLNGTPLSVPLPPRPNSRRGDINRQLYQFALGFPQTPPDEEYEIDPIGPLLNSARPKQSKSMGSFVFKW